MSDPELEPVEVIVKEEREKSYLFVKDGQEAFFPKSEVSSQRRNVKTGVAVALVPLWLLEAKGW